MRGGRFLALGLPAAVAFCACARSLGGGFASDDYLLGTYYAGLRVSDVPGLFTQPWIGSRDMIFYRPLVSLLGWLDHVVWGLEPAGWHLTNLLLHAGTASLVAALGLRLAGPFAALAAGVLFALHPLHAECVAWVSGRTDGLAASLVLVSTGFFLHARTGASCATYALALAAKEAAAPLPLALLVLDLALHRRARRALRVLPHALVLGGYLLLRLAVLGRLAPGKAGILEYVTEPALRALVFSNVVTDLGLLVASVSPAVFATPIRLTLAATLTVATAAAVLLALRSGARRTAGIVGLTLLVTLILGSPILPVAVATGTLQNGRLLLVPSAAFAVGLGMVLARAGRAGRWLGLALAVLSAAALLPLVEDWRTAGRSADSIARQTLEAWRRDGGRLPILFVDPPDSYRGAYLFRNGLEEALNPPFAPDRVEVRTTRWEAVRELIGFLRESLEDSPVLVARVVGETVRARRLGGRRTRAVLPSWAPPAGRLRLPAELSSPRLELSGLEAEGLEVRFESAEPGEIRGVCEWAGDEVGAYRFGGSVEETLVLPLLERPDWLLAGWLQQVVLRLETGPPVAIASLRFVERLPTVEVVEPDDRETRRYADREPTFRFRPPRGIGARLYRIRFYFMFREIHRFEGPLSALAESDGTRIFRLSGATPMVEFRRLRWLLGVPADLLYQVEVLAPGPEGPRLVARSPVRALRLVD